MINNKVKVECLNSLNSSERKVAELTRKVAEKVVRLTQVLSREEKVLVRKYIAAIRDFRRSFFRFGKQLL